MFEASKVKAIAIGSILLVGASIGIGMGVASSKNNKPSTKANMEEYLTSGEIADEPCVGGVRMLRNSRSRKLSGVVRCNLVMSQSVCFFTILVI